MKRLRNEDGSVSVYTVFFLLSFIILLALFMTWTGTEVTMLRVRNAMQAELNNLAIRISDDTYQAMRENNLDAYCERLTTSTVYQNELLGMVRDHLTQEIAEETETYQLSDLKLSFQTEDDCIVYTLICDVDCYLSLFGEPVTVRAEQLSLSGLHNTKEY